MSFTVSQPIPVPIVEKSPETFRHEDVTSQDPTTSPPQGVTLVQFAPVPLEVEPPTWLDVPVDPPDVSVEGLELPEHAPHRSANATMPTLFSDFHERSLLPLQSFADPRIVVAYLFKIPERMYRQRTPHKQWMLDEIPSEIAATQPQINGGC